MDDYIFLKPKVKIDVKPNAKLTSEKTALYIPTSIRNKIKFSRSEHFDNVFINHDIKSILKAITLHGKIKNRYLRGSKKGLEDDLTKQQIIIYTIVLNKGHALMYSRAREGSENKGKVIVDPRLEGKYSIGFGGHTSDKDRMEVNLLIESFKDLIPALFPEIAMVMSSTKARVSELYEELGLEPNDFKYLKLLGTFYLKLDAKELKPGDDDFVHGVHTGICAIAEINERTIGNKSLKLPRSEFGGAEWVKVNDLLNNFAGIEKAGGFVEKWSWIVARDFLDLRRSQKKKV